MSFLKETVITVYQCQNVFLLFLGNIIYDIAENCDKTKQTVPSLKINDLVDIALAIQSLLTNYFFFFSQVNPLDKKHCLLNATTFGSRSNPFSLQAPELLATGH